jgi:hypothetical protein
MVRPDRQLISLVVLAILTVGPVTGTVCAMLCVPAAKSDASSHHSPGHHRTEAASASTDVQIFGVSEQDCCDHDAAARIATRAPERADVGAASASLALTAGVRGAFRALPDATTSVEFDAPPGAAPPTTAPFVLRI